MRKILFAFIGLFLLIAHAQELFETSAGQDFVDVCNGNLKTVPFLGGALGGETLRVIVPEENRIFGMKTAPDGTVKEYSEVPYRDSTVAVHVSRAALDELEISGNPAATLKRLWGSEIRYEGLNIFSWIKFTFYDFGFRLAGLFIKDEPEIPGADFRVMGGSSKVITCQNPVVVELQDAVQKPIKQGTNNTCTPVSLIWIFERLNKTFPGMAAGGMNDIGRKLTRAGLNITMKGTNLDSIPPAIAAYINRTGYNSSIKFFANWSLENGTWRFDSDGDGKDDMTTKSDKKGIVTGGQDMVVVPASDYFGAISDELAEGEGVLIIFDDHAVAASKVDDKDLKQIEVMDPA
ncbi:MAG: hypothetical protein PHS02_04395, partial [Candidatus ainarchaeum sp.]|nr:hypothetical protein [Candidatus ainarchaeum sp.]